SLSLPITELIVLHFSHPDARLQQALHKLAAEFNSGQYGERLLRLRFQPLSTPNQTIHDIYDETDANTAWEAINDLIIQLKTEQRTLHICISGGRRILGLLTMSAAMLHFGHQDVLWHMYSSAELRQAADEGALMHLPPGAEFRLIRVPMMPWGSYFPALRQMTRPTAGAADVLAGPRAWLDGAEYARARQVIERLTERQRDVLAAFAAGLNPQRVAEKLFISIKTVDSHKTVILAECRNAWALPDDDWLDYHFLAEKFGAWFNLAD
ncbi:MAG TPA: histidine kinase, partial [Anaerolineae bacterium]|nr:histidine kinase [Anaerolineae bacterium]